MSDTSTQIRFVVETAAGRIRLEDYLFDKFSNLSRMYIRDVIKNELCEVNGKVENRGKHVRSGDFIEIELDLDRETAMRPEKIPLDILYEDDEFIGINKPAGMLVHPTHRQKNGTLLNALSFHLNSGSGAKRPGLVHRLDKETSGVIVVAKNLRSHRILARQFQKKVVRKLYVALVEGSIEKESGIIEGPIGRFADEKRWGIKADGNYAKTEYRVIRRGPGVSLLELRPVTGRTNQLRIHCASIGHPIVGDVKRGGRANENLCLHAKCLGFHHPADGSNFELCANDVDWINGFR